MILHSSALLSALIFTRACAVAFTSTNYTTAFGLISKSLEALGGESALSELRGVTYESPGLYRSRSLMQSYNLNAADTSVSITGRQNVSFDFTRDDWQLTQRIDRVFVPSEYWTWGSPQLDAFNHSLVIQGGAEGFACYVRGNNQIWYPPDVASGYTDAALAAYLVLHGEMLSPKLLLRIKEEKDNILTSVTFRGGVEMPAIYTPRLNLTIIFNSTSSLPYAVRTIEDHAIYGPSTNDLVLSDYHSVGGILFPHHVQTIYNTSLGLDAPLEEFVVQNVTLNPRFDPGFFNGLPGNESQTPRTAPSPVPGIEAWEITEFGSNMLWSGEDFDRDLVRIDNPIQGMPNVHWVVLDEDSLGVKQLILEFDSEVIVGDAPPQYTKRVIEWIETNIKKPITYVWPTHHHRDHTGGVPLYAAAGAKLIIPDVAVGFWSSIPDATFVTFNDTHPYMHKSSSLQAWFMWEPQAAHSIDQSYAVFAGTCSNVTLPLGVFEADIWHPAVDGARTNMQEARQWLDQVSRSGLARDAIVLPTHGEVRPLTELIELTAYPYPNYETADWLGGAQLGIC